MAFSIYRLSYASFDCNILRNFDTIISIYGGTVSSCLSSCWVYRGGVRRGGGGGGGVSEGEEGMLTSEMIFDLKKEIKG